MSCSLLLRLASITSLSCLALLSLCSLLIPFSPSLLTPFTSGAAGNYLIGSVPALAPGVDRLDLRFNYLTDLPTAAYQWCGANLNCLFAPSKCTTSGTVQRPAANCAFCGSTNGFAPFCSADGGVCSVDAFAPVAAGTASGPVTLALPWICAGGSVAFIKELAGRMSNGAVTVQRRSLMRAVGAVGLWCPRGSLHESHMPPPSRCLPGCPFPRVPPLAMLALKSSLGVTHTTWASNSLCTIQGKSTTVTTWAGVFCDSTGSVVNINMYSNLFFYLLDSFTTHLRSLPVLADIGAAGNFLTGSVPALAPGVVRLDVNKNYLTDLPAAAYQWCGASSNCLVAPSKCTTSGTVQRPAADCGICGTTNGIGPICPATGGVCAVLAADTVASGVDNTLSPPSLAMHCLFPPPAIKDSAGPCSPNTPSRAAWCVSPPPAACVSPPFPACPPPAMLALKASLGVTVSTWDGSVPCKVAGQTTMATVWSGVLCDITGAVVSINLQNNLFNYRLDSFTTNLRSLPALADIGVVSNYLIGSVPALSSGLLTLDLQLNFLTDLPAAAYLWCGATSNCLVTPSKCATLSTAQRPAADCAFCGTTDAVPPFCSADGGVCSVDASAPVAAGTDLHPASTCSCSPCPAPPASCLACPFPCVPPPAMLALKSSLGVTHTTWASNSSLCTIQGKSTTYTTWAGVFCDSTGSVVSM
ncbi:unnamed protein product [Closterium sp. Naga37s-1]|nr:unnamed protein product [Closterium sp. Naga37s-1]